MTNKNELPVNVEKLILENKVDELERENFLLRDQLGMRPREMPVISDINNSISTSVPEVRLCSRSAIMECELNYLKQGVDFFTEVEVNRNHDDFKTYRLSAFSKFNIRECDVPKIIQIMMGDLLEKIARDYS